jgi:exodeoxyribonuclease VII small subunit
MAKDNLKYSKAMDELEKIVLEIENDNIEVDELASKIKRASELLQICSAKLKSSEEEVEKILKDLQF